MISPKQLSNKIVQYISDAILQKKIILLMYMLYYIVYFINNYPFASFPSAYSWTEIFINYEGGYIRRGIIGQIFYELSRYVDLRFSAFFIFLCAYIFLMSKIFTYMMKNFDSITCAFIFCSPAFFLFPVRGYDIILRKDIFVEILLLLSCSICVLHLKYKSIPLALTTAIFVILYVVAFMIHEMALFYIPIPFILLGVAYDRHQLIKVWFALGVCIVLASLCLGIATTGTIEQRDAIYSSWNTYFDLERSTGDALNYIGMSLAKISDSTVSSYHKNADTMTSFVLAICLSVIPIVIVLFGYRLYRTIWQMLSTPMLRILFVPALCAPWIMPVFFNDFGRHISVTFFCYLFFLISVQSLYPQPCSELLQKWNARLRQSSYIRLWTFIFMVLYSTSWILYHWAPVGKSYIKVSGFLKLLSYLGIQF